MTASMTVATTATMSAFLLEDRFAHRFCVAPMLDVSDRHFRFVARQLTRNARLYTEMIHAAAILRGDASRLLRLGSRSSRCFGMRRLVKLQKYKKAGEGPLSLHTSCPGWEVVAQGRCAIPRAAIKRPSLALDVSP